MVDNEETEGIPAFINRARLANLIIHIPSTILLLVGPYFFIWLGIDTESALHSQRYLYSMIPGLIFFSQFDVNRSYLGAVGMEKYIAWSLLICIPVHILGCYYFIEVYKWDTLGAGLSTTIVYLVYFLVSVLFILVSPKQKKNFKCPQKEKMHDIYDFVENSSYYLLIIGFQMWNYELLTLESGMLSVNSLSTMSILLCLCLLFQVLPLSINFTANHLINRELEIKNVNLAKKYYVTIQLVGLAIILF